MITPSIRQIGFHGATSTKAERDVGAVESDAFRIEPVSRANPRSERRSNESLANAAALRLGIAAQMLASRDIIDETMLVLPSHPAMRSAARYASTAEGLAPTGTLGFSRTI